MKPFVIIKSCHLHGARRRAVRATWLNTLTLDYRFVVGNGPPLAETDVLQCYKSDAFKNIAPKLRVALACGLTSGHDQFFVCDDDTYVIPARLESFLEECSADYVGCYRHNGGHGFPLPYIQASGMVLSKRAAELVVDHETCMVEGVPDDIAVGRSLYGHLDFTDCARFHPGPVPELVPGRITTHKCLPADMYRIHEQYLKEL